MPTRSVSIHITGKSPDSRENTMAGIKSKSDVFLVES
jgi:hypothetical protein